MGDEACRVQLRLHVGELVADRLVLGDDAAELLALLRIFPGVLDRGRRETERDRGDLEFFHIETGAADHRISSRRLPRRLRKLV